jgi:hypothetical protein
LNINKGDVNLFGNIMAMGKNFHYRALTPETFVLPENE